MSRTEITELFSERTPYGTVVYILAEDESGVLYVGCDFPFRNGHSLSIDAFNEMKLEEKSTEFLVLVVKALANKVRGLT